MGGFLGVVASIAYLVAAVATAAASYRRNRILWGKPLWLAILFALFAVYFIPLTWIVWWFSRGPVAQEWERYRWSSKYPVN